jgi:hypothetical protein
LFDHWSQQFGSYWKRWRCAAVCEAYGEGQRKAVLDGDCIERASSTVELRGARTPGPHTASVRVLQAPLADRWWYTSVLEIHLLGGYLGCWLSSWAFATANSCSVNAPEPCSCESCCNSSVNPGAGA